MRALADVPEVQRERLTALIFVNAQAFSISCRTENYSFNCAADFITGTFFLHHVVVSKEERGKGTGRRLFGHFLSWVRSARLEKIRLVAAGGQPIPNGLQWETRGYAKEPSLEETGYYTWGRFGFSMLPPDNQVYESWNDYYLTKKGKFPAILNDVDNGTLWWWHGFSWRGIFFSGPGSESAIHWEEYLTGKTTRSGAAPV